VRQAIRRGNLGKPGAETVKKKAAAKKRKRRIIGNALFAPFVTFGGDSGFGLVFHLSVFLVWFPLSAFCFQVSGFRF